MAPCLKVSRCDSRSQRSSWGISALLGTNDLGQETYTALALVDPGRGLVAGFAVSFIASILDRMLSAAAADYRKKVIA